MTDTELLTQQDCLQNQARQVLAELDLIDKLDQIGLTSVVGSVDLGLMAWPDIDINTLVSTYNLEDLLKIARHLLLQTPNIGISLRDYRLDKNPSKPKGMYLGAKHWYDDVYWKIDVWLIMPKDSQSIDISARLKDISLDQRLTILRIKNKFYSHPEYRNKITSIDIYSAVLDYGAKSISDFEVYLQHTGREI